MTSNIFWIILFCTLAIISIAVIFIICSNESVGKTAKIFSDNKLVRTINLEKDGELKVENSNGYNIIRIKDGKISVIESDCKNQICVNYGEIDNNLFPIVCVPHGLVIRVENDKNSDVDIAAGAKNLNGNFNKTVLLAED